MLTLADITDPKIQAQLEAIRKRWLKSVHVPDSKAPSRRRETEIMVFSGSVQSLNQLMADIAYVLEIIKRLQRLAKQTTKT